MLFIPRPRTACGRDTVVVVLVSVCVYKSFKLCTLTIDIYILKQKRFKAYFFPLQLCAACVEKCFVGREIAVFSPFHEWFSVAILKFLIPTPTVLMRFIEIFI